MLADRAVMSAPAVAPWAVILAGGDGVRLQPLTMLVAGDARPKQFCALLGHETLLERTRRRVDLFVRFDRQVVAVSRPHEAHYRYLHGELMPGRLAVQPENRDTGPGILYALLRIKHLAGNVPVAVFPSDHYVDDDRLLVGYVRRALEVVHDRPTLVALIGIEPSSAETDYGWIEPAPVALPTWPDVFPVWRFVEKPPASRVGELIGRGCLWNSFVMVGWVETWLELIARTAPHLYHAFDAVPRALGMRHEAAVLERVYGSLPAISFARRVLTRAAGRLVTLAARGLQWSDWGSPQRVLATLRATQQEPPWLGRVQAQVGQGQGLQEGSACQSRVQRSDTVETHAETAVKTS
jgi:mannose-1-phosphate guanylyltransferase